MLQPKRKVLLYAATFHTVSANKWEILRLRSQLQYFTATDQKW